MPKLNYAELLKHPKWQKRRLDVLGDADFQCSNCGSKEKQLHVHHGHYVKGRKPWEYPDEELHCLCEECHLKFQEKLVAMYEGIAMLGYWGDLDTVHGFIEGTVAISNPFRVISVKGGDFLDGLAKAWNLPINAIVDVLTESGAIDGQVLHRLRLITKAY